MSVPKKYEHIDLKPPKGVADAAKRGLEYRRETGKGGLSSQEAGKEGIGSGVQRAVNLSNRNNLTIDTIKMMRGFFSRHEKNKGVAEGKKPQEDAGHVAWLLWGGDPGKKWVDKILKQMEDADKKEEEEKKKSANSDEKELMKILRLLQRRFGSAKRWYESGFEDQYVSIDKGILLFSYTTGLRGEEADDYDMETDIRIDNKKQVEKFLKSKGYDFVLECASPYCDILMLTLKGEDWMKKHSPKYAKRDTERSFLNPTNKEVWREAERFVERRHSKKRKSEKKKLVHKKYEQLGGSYKMACSIKVATMWLLSKKTWSKDEVAVKTREVMEGNSKEDFLKAVSKVTGVSKKILSEVHERGARAWQKSHTPGVTQVAWARARVYSFVSGGTTQKTTDNDLWREHSGEKKKDKKACFKSVAQRYADLNPALGISDSPCDVLRRIDQEVGNIKKKDKLMELVEEGHDLKNSEAHIIYSPIKEQGYGKSKFKNITITPHAQYRMDLRGIEVKEINSVLFEFQKVVQREISQRGWSRWEDQLENYKVAYTGSKGLKVVFEPLFHKDVPKFKNLMGCIIISAYYKNSKVIPVPRSQCKI